MDYEHIIVEIHGPWGLVRPNRAASLNALSFDLRDEPGHGMYSKPMTARANCATDDTTTFMEKRKPIFKNR